MEEQTLKSEAVTSATTDVEPGREQSTVESMLLDSDDITQQNQTAQLFFEALLQTSRTQLLTDCGVSSVNRMWPDSQVTVSHDCPMTDASSTEMFATPSVTVVDSMKMSSASQFRDKNHEIVSKVPNFVGTNSVKVVSPQMTLPKMAIKQSTSPDGLAASPKKRSRKKSSMADHHDNHMTEEGLDHGGSGEVGGRQQGLERGVNESSSDTVTTPRRRVSHISNGGRRSRTQSESENDIVSDSVSMLTSFPPDDIRRQMTGSITPETDVGFQPSMLDAVLTEKKLALLRSPEVRQFLQQQQIQKAKERKLTHGSPTVGSKGDQLS